MSMVFDAVQVLKNTAKVSDLAEAPTLSDRNQIFLKLETQQRTKAFKLRGAYYLMSKLTDEQKKRGVVTCSSGNHAQGVGFAADQFNVKATIFLPSSTPLTKIEAVRAYRNADVRLVKGTFDDALTAALEFQKNTDAIYVPPFDNYNIIAGQGTVGWEIINQLPDADIIVVPIGGGGLISGIAFVVKTLKPSCLIYGVQAEQAAAMFDSRNAGKPVTLDRVSTLADGTAVKRPGTITFDLCQKYVDQIVTVNETQIANAIARLFRECGVTAEGAGALSVAAVVNGKIPATGKKIVCLISGGNIDRDNLEKILKENDSRK
ncbi:MAG: pyridoxal-phosphate dependent enzyme [Victivallales bacterium]|jgi:threonine dehydratase|nr:pyridoxal-phosphate dependent enzyme [Victivallales bacterium]